MGPKACCSGFINGLKFTHFSKYCTGQIPNMLKLGRKVTFPLQVVIESPKEILEAPDVNEYGQEMQTRMHLAHEIARKTLKRKTEHQKRYYQFATSEYTIHGNVLNTFTQLLPPNLFII
jgi:hypothetical protein